MHKSVLVVTEAILDLCKRSLVSAEPFPVGLNFGEPARVLIVFSFYL